MYRRQGRLDDAIRAPHSQAAQVGAALALIRSTYSGHALLMQEKHNEAQETFKRSKALPRVQLMAIASTDWARFGLIAAHVALGEHSDAQKQLDFLAG